MSDIVPTAAPQPAPRVRSGVARVGLWKILLLVVAAAVSFAVVSQLRDSGSDSQDLSVESEGDLARILASLSSEASAQQDQLSLLKVELANLQNSSANQGTQSAAVQAQLNALQVLAGTVPVTGPGLEISITDPAQKVTFDVLVDTVQELRDAGAEAIAVNGRRVGGSSYFGSANGQVTLDGQPMTTPITVSAIGPASTMEGGLQIPGGSLDTLRALPEVKADTHRSTALTIAALAQQPTFRAASPVDSDS